MKLKTLKVPKHSCVECDEVALYSLTIGEDVNYLCEECFLKLYDTMEQSMLGGNE